MSIALIILLVLIVLCGIVGSIYAYLYFTRINPTCLRRSRLYSQTGVGAAVQVGDDGGGPGGLSQTMTSSTHVFLFRK